MDIVEYNNPLKVYVAVTLRHDEEGGIHPISFEWEDGRTYSIDEVLDVRRQASTKAGGIGIRYLCRVMGKQVPLYYEDVEPYRWFMERKEY